MEIDLTSKKLIRIVKRPPVNIEFNQLRCVIEKKTILKSVSGKFSSGHLTGILGTSGAGKTTLLNVLAGQLHYGISGNILVNNKPKNTKNFRRISSYIMQEDLVQPLLTVKESLKIAADLKVASTFSKEEKESMVLGILSVIGLESCIDTKVEYLSGGERKRLIIALELVNNPAVIFLDEPTTGLDEVAVKNCLQLLKSLTLQGRTIICTMHQPSDSMFKLFDRVYFMSDGFCVYNGSVPELIPYLSNVHLPCPSNYNPADYIIEISHAESSNTIALRDAISNGEKVYLENSILDLPQHIIRDKSEEKCFNLNEYPVSFWTQFSVLTKRFYLQMSRNKKLLAIHFVHNSLCGLVLGLLFYQIGPRGSQVMLNYKCLFSIVIFFMFTHLMSPILFYPFEAKLLEREYFNRWYSLKAYFAAFTAGQIPIIIVTSIIFTCLTYFLSGQPLEWYRFWRFCFVCVLMSITSHGFGYAIGALFSPMRGACVGSALGIPLVLLAISGIGYGDTLESYMKVLMTLSFPYHAFAALAVIVYESRGILECDELLCIFGDTQYSMIKMGLIDKTYTHEVLSLIIFCVLHRILFYFSLRIRLSPECAIIRNLKIFEM